MFKRLIKNKKAQNTAEYAILISLVVAGIIAMQTYAQRALQAKVRDASAYLAAETGSPEHYSVDPATGERWELGSTPQYEPYYLESNYETTRDSREQKFLDEDTVRESSQEDRRRLSGGFQESGYNAEATGIFGAAGEFPNAP